jgi:hypothetical protein
MGEVAQWGYLLQAKFGDRLRQGASESGRLSDGREIGQVFGGNGGVNNARGEGFHAEAGDGSERETSHGLRGKMGGQLRGSERVNALASGGESADDEFICASSRGSNDEDFGVRLFRGQERGGLVQERGVRAGVNERARGHRQLYSVEICQDAALRAGNREIRVIAVANLGDLASPIATRVVFVPEASFGAVLMGGPIDKLAIFVDTVPATFIFGSPRDEIAVFVVLHHLAVAAEPTEG